MYDNEVTSEESVTALYLPPLPLDFEYKQTTGLSSVGWVEKMESKHSSWARITSSSKNTHANRLMTIGERALTRAVAMRL